jgi:hypothetical protein
MLVPDRHPALNTGLRVLMAIFGGYALALLAAAALAIGMPFSFRPDAVSLATMLAFLLYLLAVIWSFAAATLLSAALGLALPAGAFWLWLLAARGAP